MTIFKRGSVYWFEFETHGVRHRESTGIRLGAKDGKQRAKAIEANYRMDLVEKGKGIKRKQAAPSFKEAMTAFLVQSEIDHSDHPDTTKRYVTSSKPLLRFFGGAVLDAITSEDVEKYRKRRKAIISEKTGRKLRPATINRELACLRVVFNHFSKVAPENPVNDVEFEPEDNERMRFLSHEEEAIYLADASQPLRDLVVLALDCGLRAGEAVKITKRDVNFDAGTLFIPKGKTKEARRYVPLTARVAEVLRERVESAEGVCLFPHAKDINKPMKKVNNAHYGVLRRTELEHVTIHDLRHTFGSRMAEAGTDIATLAALMGHRKITTTMRYVHPSAQHKTAAIQKLDAHNAARQPAALAA